MNTGFYKWYYIPPTEEEYNRLIEEASTNDDSNDEEWYLVSSIMFRLPCALQHATCSLSYRCLSNYKSSILSLYIISNHIMSLLNEGNLLSAYISSDRGLFHTHVVIATTFHQKQVSLTLMQRPSIIPQLQIGRKMNHRVVPFFGWIMDNPISGKLVDPPSAT